MTDANNKTRTVTPAPASEKTEATPALDKIRRFKESKARMREFQAREGDLWAFYRELRRQTEALSKQPAKDQAMLPSLLRLGEEVNSILASSAEESVEIVREYLQGAQDYPVQAAEENDPQSKRPRLADSEKAAPIAASIKKEPTK